MSPNPCREFGDDAFEQASLFVLGLMEPGEADVYFSHTEICEKCRGGLEEARELVAGLAVTAPIAAPSESLRDRVLASVRDAPASPQVWKDWNAHAESDVHVVRGEEGLWTTVHPGVHVKQLNADAVRDSVTMLIRMDAGASWMPHRHGGPEQCFVLEGDLQEEDLSLRGGDYQCAGEGSIHDRQWTEKGCLLLIVCSQHDELLAG